MAKARKTNPPRDEEDIIKKAQPAKPTDGQNRRSQRRTLAYHSFTPDVRNAPAVADEWERRLQGRPTRKTKASAKPYRIPKTTGIMDKSETGEI